MLKNENLSCVEYRKAMQQACKENEAVVNSFFVEKFKHYLNEFLIKSMNITAYWITQEWAKRGAIHVHCLWWIKDQPDLIGALNCKDKDKQLNMLQESLNWFSF